MPKTSRFLTFVITSLALLAILWMVIQIEVYAQGTCLNNITVTNNGDSGPGTIRQALADVCNDGTVGFAPGLADQTITLTSAELSITKTVAITNPNAPNLKVSGNNAHRVFNIQSGAKVTISHLSIISGAVINTNGGGILLNSGASLTFTNSVLNGNSAKYGGGIHNEGNLVLINSTIISNTGGGIRNDNTLVVTNSTFQENLSGGGGGIFNNGTATVNNSMFNKNTSSCYGGSIYNNGILMVDRSIFASNSASSSCGGGGVYNDKLSSSSGGELYISNSTFVNNSGGEGGGILNTGPHIVIVNNSTFSNNLATQTSTGGGGILNFSTSGTITVTNSTFDGNSNINGQGGGIVNYYGKLHIINNIIANSLSDFDCRNRYGTILTNLNNLVEDSSCDAAFSGDPKLGSLQNNGGPTPTYALLPGSPAINAGDNTTCLTEDQRGITRPQQGQCDIGAFESRGFTLAISGGNNQTTTIGTPFSVPLELTIISNAGNEPVNDGSITFTAPTSGPSVTFAPMIMGTILNGEVLLTATANITAGSSYTVVVDTVGGNSVNFTMTNTKTTPNISVTVPVSPSIVGQIATFTVEVSSTIRMPTGSVTLFIDGIPQLPLPLHQGYYVSFDITTLLTGTRVITATYGGDDNFSANVSDEVTHTVVEKAHTTTSIITTTPNPSKVGQPITVTYSVDVVAPDTGSPSNTVIVGDGSTSCEGTVAEGRCTLIFTTLGTKVITATYGGDDDFNASVSDEVTHTVVEKAHTTTSIITTTPNPSKVGQPITVTYSVDVVAPDTGSPSNAVIVGDGSTSCEGTVAEGRCTLAFTTPGTKVITATYGGDDNFNASVSDEVTHTVEKAHTTTSIITTTPNPSKVGQPITVTYSVYVVAPGAGSPSNTVIVGDGSTSCEGTVAERRCTLTFTISGTMVITATYGGDDNFNASVSDEVTHTVEIIQNKVFLPVILKK